LVLFKKSFGYWNNKNNCLVEAKKYNTITEFKYGSNGAYKSAHKNGWFEYVTKHMRKPIIYGVKTGNVFHYIGKTNKPKRNIKLRNSDVTRQYTNSNKRSIFLKNKNIDIIQIRPTEKNIWSDDKLSEVVKKYNENHPLLNTQWMLNGKRGYWSGTKGYWIGKKRDQNTINKLSESKYKRVVQYNKEGNLIKIWNSGKEIGLNILNDYKITKHGGHTKLYHYYKNKYLKTFHGSYWIKEDFLLKKYEIIPTNIIDIIIESKNIKQLNRTQNYVKATMRSKYTVIHYNVDNTIKTTYKNVNEAGYILKLHVHTIERLCRGEIINSFYILKYGEKLSQPINQKYYYTTEPMIKENKTKLKIKTNITIEQYDKNNNLIKTFKNIDEAAEYFNCNDDRIRYICRGCCKKTELFLKIGQKVKIFI
jgi:hypothetical protein